MAIVNKIRENSGVAITVIAVALLLFIVGGDLIGNGRLFGGNRQIVGEIAGHEIQLQDFQKQFDQARMEYEAQTGQSANEQVQAQLREKVWNDLVMDYAYQKEFDALGLEVSPEEANDMFFGRYIDPAVRQAFTNPQTGIFDKAAIAQQRSQIMKMPAGSPQQVGWQSFVRDVQRNHLMNRFLNLMRLSSYVTQAEARKDYEAQTAKADVRYVFVPFQSIPDSTIKVSDAQLSDYLSRHRDEFESSNTRSMQYVAFGVAPSAADSVALKNTLTQIAKNLATMPNDSAYARASSDVQHPLYWTMNDMDDQLKAAVRGFFPGQIVGPFREGNTYTVYKYGGTRQDSLSTMRASHILIRPTDSTATAKAAARQRAEDILRQLRGGADFAAMAAQNSMDPGSAQQGGDLGFFKNNHTMIKPFEDALFAHTGTGLLPRVVETDFGYHIVKVTEPKDNRLYRLIAVSKQLAPSQATREVAFRRAQSFAAENRSLEAIKAATTKDRSLLLLRADRVPEGSTNINMMPNAQDMVRWAFNDNTKVGDVSNVMEINDAYVVGVLTGKTSADEVRVEDYREDLTARVRNQLKGEQIKAKLAGLSGPLEQIAQKYGAGALLETATGLTPAGTLGAGGADPAAIGVSFGQKAGQISKPVIGEGGVYVVQTLSKTPAPQIADYSQYKTNALMQQMQRVPAYVNEAIRKASDIKDYRARFF